LFFTITHEIKFAILFECGLFRQKFFKFVSIYGTITASSLFHNNFDIIRCFPSLYMHISRIFGRKIGVLKKKYWKFRCC